MGEYDGFRTGTEILLYEETKVSANRMKRFVDSLDPAQGQEWRDDKLAELINLLPRDLEQTKKLLKSALDEYA